MNEQDEILGAALSREIENDWAMNPGSMTIVFQLDEGDADQFAAWLDGHKDKLLYAPKGFQRGVINFGPGTYRIAKSQMLIWPEDGPVFVCPIFYVPVSGPQSGEMVPLCDLLEPRLGKAEHSIWTAWYSDEDLSIMDAQ